MASYALNGSVIVAFCSRLDRTLFGFIVFQVAWKDVRCINYLNELQTDTSLAIEAKYMKRWEFDSINQAVKRINTWDSTQTRSIGRASQLHASPAAVFNHPVRQIKKARVARHSLQKIRHCGTLGK
ncbi:hypothetical protein M8C21_021159 [Ambrosia artemisiifolia]|uniref:Uncharacterized protein n=1 Tax=Ambrosia artemisiifolia TaxID=4212 RepID=A0AAD5GLS1_AMBAR|nr:hypothetical protein M8C21_021159 [Ambrosia artemisiifolia]